MAACSPDPVSATTAGDASETAGDAGDEVGESDESDTGEDLDQPLSLAVTATRIRDGGIDLLSIDLSDLDVASPPVLEQSVGMGDLLFLEFGPSAPPGSALLLTSESGVLGSELLSVSELGEFERGPLLPAPLPPYGSRVHWSADHDAALILARVDSDDPGVLQWVQYVDGEPVEATPLSAQQAPDTYLGVVTLAADDSGVFYLSRAGEEPIYELFYAPLTDAPSPGVAFAQLEIPSQEDFAVALDGDKLLYRYDDDFDGVGDFWSLDIDDLQAPPALLTTILAGSARVRLHWSEDRSQLLYWTGDGFWGELYLVEFDGALPTEPVRVDSDARPCNSKDFQFDSLGRVLYTFGEDEKLGVVRVELVAGEPGPSAVLTEALPPGAHITAARYGDDSLIYQVDGGDELGWLARVSYASPVASPPLRVLDGITDDTVAFSVPEPGQPLVVTAERGEGRQLLSIDLDDPRLVPLDLGASLPEGWSLPIGYDLSPDGRQVFVTTGPAGQPDQILLRTRTDGAGPFEVLMELGYQVNRHMLLTP